MKIVRFFALLMLALSPPIVLLTYDRVGQFFGMTPAAQDQAAAPGESEQNNQELEAALAIFNATYQAELAAYQQEILAQWGEIRNPPASTWVSYEASDPVRRTVDYQSGRVEVELIVNTDQSVDQVKGHLDRAVHRLMNTTETEAYATDVVANRVEQKLASLGDLLQKGETSHERLFAVDDFTALTINYDSYFKVAADAASAVIPDIRPSALEDKYILRASFRIPHTIHERAIKYSRAVTAAAEKEKIDDELIYAIIETESSFNPMARSHIPAYGLMQIVPATAGKDATRYLYGKSRILAPSYLYNPNNNIAIGAAYLHLLHYKYMRRVKNKESRLYCAIAAYNTGPSNVAKAFIDQASFNRAVAVINQLSPQQVYDKLRKLLPQKETRVYIEKVSRRMEKYL